jgi:hypothetical protein
MSESGAPPRIMICELPAARKLGLRGVHARVGHPAARPFNIPPNIAPLGVRSNAT